MPVSRERSLFSHTIKGRCYFIKSKPIRPDNSNTKFSPFFKTIAGEPQSPSPLSVDWFSSFIADGTRQWVTNPTGIILDFSSFHRGEFFYKYELYVRKISDKVPLTLNFSALNDSLNYKNGTTHSASDVVCTTSQVIDSDGTHGILNPVNGGQYYAHLDISGSDIFSPFGSGGALSSFSITHSLSSEHKVRIISSLGLGGFNFQGNRIKSIYFLNNEMFAFMSGATIDNILRGLGGTEIGDHPIGTEVHYIPSPTPISLPDLSSTETLFNLSGTHGETYLIWAREVNIFGNTSDWVLMAIDTIPVDSLLETVIEDYGYDSGGGA